MQNDFEKDVRQKMDELKLAPSAQVWEGVEAEIKGGKRKRRGLLWILFAALLLAGGWLGYQQSDTRRSATEESTARAPLQPADNKLKRPPAGPAAKPVAEPERNLFPRRQQKTTQRTAPLGNRRQPSAAATVAQTKQSVTPRQSGTELTRPSNGKRPQGDGIEHRRNEASSIRPKNPSAPPMTSSADTPATANQSPPARSDSATNKGETKEPVSPKAGSGLIKKVASVNKWRKQITLDAGISGYAEGPFFQAFNSNARDAPSAAVNAIGSPAVVAAQPSKVTSGFYFSIGFAKAKSMGRRWEIAAGLHYTYASTHQKVGDKKTADSIVRFAADKSTANGFYTNAGTNDYANRFHLIEVPVSLSFRPSLRLPLYVSTGVVYGRLLATNALTYSSASDLYYRNGQNYLRNAFSLSSSVQVEFYGKKKASLRTGPFVQYNLLKLRTENGNGTPHRLAAGLHTALIF